MTDMRAHHCRFRQSLHEDPKMGSPALGVSWGKEAGDRKSRNMDAPQMTPIASLK